jgi:hypothetical protein
MPFRAKLGIAEAFFAVVLEPSTEEHSVAHPLLYTRAAVAKIFENTKQSGRSIILVKQGIEIDSRDPVVGNREPAREGESSGGPPRKEIENWQIELEREIKRKRSPRS